MIEKGVITHIGSVEQVSEKLTKLLFVIEKQDGQYKKSIAFELINNAVGQLDGVGVGSEVEVKADVSSREYNGRWYTQAKAWAVNVMSAVHAEAPTATANAEDDDLPF